MRDVAAVSNLKEVVKALRKQTETLMTLTSVVKRMKEEQYEQFYKHVTFVLGALAVVGPVPAGQEDE